ncbi:MAG: DNA replication and repair protein RecF [Treponema sp.]|nr:DNA replication and repair protein RecF [Treponema sp.]
MIFRTLRTLGFRNLADAETNIQGKDVFLVGENGQGKTNFLEAIYFCSYASSFRGVSDREVVREGEQQSAVAAHFAGSGARDGSPDKGVMLYDQVLITYEHRQKNVYLDGKRIEDRRDLLGVAPSIVFCHEDMEFVTGSPERRRWFFDQTLGLADPGYLEDLRKYRRVLKTRNTLLKTAAEHPAGTSLGPMLDALDPQLAFYGLKLMEKRETAAAGFSETFGALYEQVTGLDQLGLRYAPSWKALTLEDIQGFLAEHREQDRASGLTLSGPHRDRYLFIRGQREFAGQASTGQRRLLALLLRVAQARRFSELTGKDPVLLLDDVLLELDPEKRWKFLGALPEYAQAFFTFLPDEPYHRYRTSRALVYQVSQGSLSSA